MSSNCANKRSWTYDTHRHQLWRTVTSSVGRVKWISMSSQLKLSPLEEVASLGYMLILGAGIEVNTAITFLRPLIISIGGLSINIGPTMRCCELITSCSTATTHRALVDRSGSCRTLYTLTRVELDPSSTSRSVRRNTGRSGQKETSWVKVGIHVEEQQGQRYWKVQSTPCCRRIYSQIWCRICRNILFNDSIDVAPSNSELCSGQGPAYKTVWHIDSIFVCTSERKNLQPPVNLKKVRCGIWTGLSTASNQALEREDNVSPNLWRMLTSKCAIMTAAYSIRWTRTPSSSHMLMMV